MNLLITGASGGIGGAVARLMAADKANAIYALYNTGGERAEALSLGRPNIRTKQCDLSRSENIAALARDLAGADIDAVVHCAFPRVTLTSLQKLDWALVEEGLRIGAKAAFELSLAFAPAMKKRGKGAIVTVLSSATLDRVPAQMSAYVIAKYAQLGVHQALFAELAPFGIRVNAVSPSLVRTDFISGLPDHYVAMMEAASPSGRLATPENVAVKIRHVLSDSSAPLNGANLPVSGT